MLTRMSETDWDVVVRVFRAVRSRRGDKGRDDRKFLEAVHSRSTTSRGGRGRPSLETGTLCGNGSGA